MENNIFRISSSISTTSSNTNQIDSEKEENLFNQKIWKDFPEYWLTFTYDNFSNNIKKLVSEKKNFFLYLYGTHDKNGRSWCPDCVRSEPFVNKAKEIIAARENEKEIYFVNIPIDIEKRPAYRNDKIVKMRRVPTLAYFNKGRELGRIVEHEMDTQDMVDGFILQVYDEDF
jgi:thiol-disulfide isomerase/thioredoxin